MAAFEVIALDTATPQLRAPGAADTYTFPRAVEMPLGTANGVLYLNGSKVVTSGSALTFDGTLLGVGSDVVVSPSNGLTRLWGNTKRFAWMAFNASYYMEISADAPSRAINYTVNSGDGTATHIWSLGAAGTPSEQMRLTSTGLGIGTSSPGAKLDVNDGANSEMRVTTSGSGYLQVGQFTNGAFIGTSSTDATAGILRFGTGGTTRATINTSGNLGLGVTPSAWVSYTALQVASIGGALSSSSSSDFEITTNAYYNGGWLSQGAGVASTRYRLLSGSHSWWTSGTSPGVAGSPISFTQAMTLDASGNLLVGTTSSAITVNGLKFLADGSFYTVQNSGVTSSVYNKSNYTSGTDFFADFRLANTTVGSISADGSTTSYNTSSDRRLKENVAPAPSASDDIDAIQIVSHDWKSGFGEHVKYGVIAQDLHAVAPQAVTAGDDGDEIEKTWGVDYSKLVPMLIKEIQSLRARVAAIEA